MKRILLLPSILLAILIAPLAGHAANPSFADLSNGPVYLGPIIQSANASNSLGVVSAALVDVAPIIVNTSTNTVYLAITIPGVYIKTNSTYNLFLYANGVTNAISGDPVWIDVRRYGTNFWVRY